VRACHCYFCPSLAGEKVQLHGFSASTPPPIVQPCLPPKRLRNKQPRRGADSSSVPSGSLAAQDRTAASAGGSRTVQHDRRTRLMQHHLLQACRWAAMSSGIAAGHSRSSSSNRNRSGNNSASDSMSSSSGSTGSTPQWDQSNAARCPSATGSSHGSRGNSKAFAVAAVPGCRLGPAADRQHSLHEAVALGQMPLLCRQHYANLQHQTELYMAQQQLTATVSATNLASPRLHAARRWPSQHQQQQQQQQQQHQPPPPQSPNGVEWREQHLAKQHHAGAWDAGVFTDARPCTAGCADDWEMRHMELVGSSSVSSQQQRQGSTLVCWPPQLPPS